MTYIIQKPTKKFSPDAKFFATLWILTVVLFIGATANFHAVQTNGGRMPVQHSSQDTDRHFSFDEKSEVNNYYLTDIIRIPFIKSYSLTTSIGDIILITSWLGMAIVMFSYLRKGVKK